MAKIGFIGMGNMGYAILKGLLNVYGKEEIIFTDVNPGRCRQVSEETGVSFAACNAECAASAKYIVLSDIAGTVTKDHIIISIAPGITVDSIRETLGADKRIVRAMPNTPALLGEGMTGVCYDPALFAKEEQETIRSLFESFGKMQTVEERLMNAVVCVSGSSPAYVYMFIERPSERGSL